MWTKNLDNSKKHRYLWVGALVFVLASVLYIGAAKALRDSEQTFNDALDRSEGLAEINRRHNDAMRNHRLRYGQ